MGIVRHEPGPTLSRATAFHHWIFLSGTTADDTSVGIQEQTRQVLTKIDRYLAMAGSDKSGLLSATVFLADPSQRAEMDQVWTSWLHPDIAPPRTCLGATLDGKALVEIMAIARD